MPCKPAAYYAGSAAGHSRGQRLPAYYIMKAVYTSTMQTGLRIQGATIVRPDRLLQRSRSSRANACALASDPPCASLACFTCYLDDCSDIFCEPIYYTIYNRKSSLHNANPPYAQSASRTMPSNRFVAIRCAAPTYPMQMKSRRIRHRARCRQPIKRSMQSVACPSDRYCASQRYVIAQLSAYSCSASIKFHSAYR